MKNETPQRYREIKAILEERITQYQPRIAPSSEDESSSIVGQILDNAIEFVLEGVRLQNLQKYEEALKRLEEGVYGFCFECGNEISIRRLRALPFSVRCLPCEEARELKAQ